MATIHNAKDNSFKLVLDDHDLFSKFLRDFVRIDLLNDAEPAGKPDAVWR